MKFKLTLMEKVLGAGLIILLIIFSIRECSNRRDKDNLVNDLSNYKDSAQYYNLKVDGMEVEVAYNKSLVLETNKQVKSVLSSVNDTIAKLVKKFKDIRSGTIINNYTTINNDTIKLTDSIPCDFKAFKVRRDSLHYKFIGTIARTYFTIDSLIIPNKQYIIIGRKKLGFLKGYEERAEIINSNPLVKVTNIESYVINKRKKRLGIGASVGYGLTLSNSASLSPYLGISLNYNLIQF